MIMDSFDGRIPPIIAENKTSDGLRFLYERINHNAYVRFREEDVARVISEFGSSDPDFVIPLLHQIGKLGIKEKNWDPDIVKFVISFVRGTRPRDQISALLGFHMMTVHQTIMVNFGRINQARFMQYNEEEENADRAVNSLARTLIRLAEAFDRHQNGGEQKLTVRHMTVANRRRVAKASKRPKRGIENVTPLMNGAANGMEGHGEGLLSKNKDGE
jgi:hypothetical protein